MNRFIYIGLCWVILFAACKKEYVPLTVPEGTIYMDKSSKSRTANLNFATYADSIREVVLELKMNITGEPVNFDRSYQLEVQPSSTAVAGTNYELIASEWRVPAGALNAIAHIKLKRTAEIQEDTAYLVLKLVPGKDFANNVVDFDPVHKIAFYDMVTMPENWMYIYEEMDEFSPKKFQLLQTISGMPVDALNGEMTEEYYSLLLSQAKFWAILLKKHLDEQKALGTPVLEEDGTPMILGYNFR